MLSYSNGSNLQNNTYVDTLLNRADSSQKEYLVRLNSTTPQFIKYLIYYTLYHDVFIRLNILNTVTRSTYIPSVFTNITNRTNPNNTGYDKPFYYDDTQFEAWNIKHKYGVVLVPVSGQIQTFFDEHLPEYVKTHQLQEQLNVSLYLKASPRHRVRVYKRGNHLIVFTTLTQNFDIINDDYAFIRKVFASIPLVFGWQEEHPHLVELYKSLGFDSAETYYTLLNAAYTATPALADLKYKQVIDSFQSINQRRLTHIDTIVQDYQQRLRNTERQFCELLQKLEQTYAERLYIEDQSNICDVDLIKTLVNKKVCYDVDATRIARSSAELVFRCSASCLGFNKDAAQRYFDRVIKRDCNLLHQKLFTQLFIDETVVLCFDEEIKVSFTNKTITARGSEVPRGDNFNMCFPNPHHYYHNCWGSYSTAISRLIAEFNLENLFYQIKAAVGSLNFNDPTVISEFKQMLKRIVNLDYTPACFYWKDEDCKTLHTFEETIEHFKDYYADALTTNTTQTEREADF